MEPSKQMAAEDFWMRRPGKLGWTWRWGGGGLHDIRPEREIFTDHGEFKEQGATDSEGAGR